MPHDTISFARGAPSLDIIPVTELRECASRALKKDPAGAFSYGKATGYQPLREWIAAKHGVETGQVLLTNGSMQADAFLFELLVNNGDEVIVEAPTYDRTLLSLRNRGAKIAAVPLEADGINVGAVGTMLESGLKPKLAHIIPNFHNPGGCTLSLDKRKQLLGLAEQHDFTIFEDDPYIDIRFEGEPIETLISLDDSDHVVYASSFSKTICPGVRVGYLVGPAELIADVARIATETYISPSMVAQAIVAEFCISGAIDSSIATVKKNLLERLNTLEQALNQCIPDARFVRPQGGYFLWVELPDQIDVAALVPLAEEEGVVCVKGTDFLIEGGSNCLRLAYSGVTPSEIEEGVARLANAIERLG